MLRRNFLKKILFTGLSLAIFKVKLFANEVLTPFNLKDGIFINNFIDHRKSFKEFWKWRKESKRPEPITFPLAQNDPSYLKNNTLYLAKIISTFQLNTLVFNCFVVNELVKLYFCT